MCTQREHREPWCRVSSSCARQAQTVGQVARDSEPVAHLEFEKEFETVGQLLTQSLRQTCTIQSMELQSCGVLEMEIQFEGH